MSKIALAGNPNCGKTTMFNALTGSNQYVGNWPGVTVEKKEGKLKGHKDVTIVDLPGIYSLSPYSLDEVVARNYLLEESPDMIINLVDATNLERNLYLTTQLIETGIPVVIALNMMDLIKANGDKIHAAALAKDLGCQVVEISALKNQGLDTLIKTATQALQQKSMNSMVSIYDGNLQEAIHKVCVLIERKYEERKVTWYAVKYLENDEKIMEKCLLNEEDRKALSTIRDEAENVYDDDMESVITNARYEFIARTIKDSYKKAHSGLTTSDKIDQIVTNR